MSIADNSSSEANLTSYLQRLAGLALVVVIVTLIVPYILRGTDFFIAAPFFVTNSIAGIGLIAVTGWLAAGDVRRYRLLVSLLALGILIGAISFVALYFSPGGRERTTTLLIAFAVYAIIGLLLGWFVWRARPQQPPWSPWIPGKPLTGWERVGQVVYGLFGIGSIFGAIATIVLAYSPDNPLAQFWVQPVFVSGSAVKIGLLGLISLAVALKIRHRLQLIVAVILGHGVSLVVITILAIFGYGRFGDFTLSVAGMNFGVPAMMFGAWLLDVVIIAGFAFIQFRINDSVIDNISFFDPLHFRVFEAIIETLIEGGQFERIQPYEVALNTDLYLSSFRSNRLFLAKLALLGTEYFPLLWLLPPMTFMNPSRRRNFINSRFKTQIINPPFGYRIMNVILRLINRILLMVRGRSVQIELDASLDFIGLLEGIMRFDMQLSYIGYYGDERSWPKQPDGSGIGYVPFSRRENAFPIVPQRPYPELKVMTPEFLAQRGIDSIDDADVVIIGSGAAGAILAEQLADKGRRVLILEKGIYAHPDTFSEDEIDMVSRLYSDGALQLSQSLRFTILQGSAVGGTTVVNNAVCFDTPERVLDAWNARNEGNVIDKVKFRTAQQAVRNRLKIGRIQTATRQPLEDALNHGDIKITEGVKRYFAKHPEMGNYEYNVVDANITDCLGCGYCNIGCKFGRKLSMLDEVLPAAQAKHGEENFRILSETEATHLDVSNGKITGITAQIRGKSQLVIRNPKTVILSAGTIASSWLLMRSGIGKNLPIGQGLCFNMGSPLYGWFGETLNAYDGLQIAHFLDIKDRPGFVYETWYNPPVAQALAMPGWLDTHFRNMLRYNEMAAVGVLVGTESNAYIEPALLTGGPDVVYRPSRKDLDTLLDALIIIGGVLFEAGAKEVFASTRKYYPYAQHIAHLTQPDAINNLRELVKDDSDILLGTGHPQGGNAIGSRPDGDHASVVDGQFKVFGYDNLYVCDASVHPSATTVNPQLTVMGLAHYASEFIE